MAVLTDIGNLPDLITDRTASDVSRLQYLLQKGGITGWSAAEKTEFLQNSKGAYNASDLNRVGVAVQYIVCRLKEHGYLVNTAVKLDWSVSDIPRQDDMERYRQNIVNLREVLAVMPSTPAAPESMQNLNYKSANDIEQILLDVDALIRKIIPSCCYAGEVYAGEV